MRSENIVKSAPRCPTPTRITVSFSVFLSIHIETQEYLFSYVTLLKFRKTINFLCYDVLFFIDQFSLSWIVGINKLTNELRINICYYGYQCHFLYAVWVEEAFFLGNADEALWIHACSSARPFVLPGVSDSIFRNPHIVHGWKCALWIISLCWIHFWSLGNSRWGLGFALVRACVRNAISNLENRDSDFDDFLQKAG